MWLLAPVTAMIMASSLPYCLLPLMREWETGNWKASQYCGMIEFPTAH
jgi:hypothetical protein